MTQRHTHQQWLNCVRFIAESTDAPPQAQEAARKAIHAYNSAIQFYDNEWAATLAIIHTEHDARANIAPKAFQAISGKKKTTFDADVIEIAQLTQARETAELRASYALKVENLAASHLTSDILPHKADLFAWIAKRRNEQPTACGEIDTLPKELQNIYARLGILWLTPWQDGLTLGDSPRLPLIYHAAWSPEYRASLAWVWQQVLNGDIELVPHPRNKDKTPTLYAPTRRVMSLPHVPPVPPAPSRRSPAFGRG